MLFNVSMFPICSTESLAHPVAEVIDAIDDAGLSYQVTGMSTVIEGEWDAVMPVLKRAEARLSREYGRVFMNLQLDDEAGARGGRLRGAVDAVAHELGRTVAR